MRNAAATETERTETMTTNGQTQTPDCPACQRLRAWMGPSAQCGACKQAAIDAAPSDPDHDAWAAQMEREKQAAYEARVQGREMRLAQQAEAEAERALPIDRNNPRRAMAEGYDPY